MEIIPVIDLRGGQAVHARLGLRDQFQPVDSALLHDRPGDVMALARAYRAMPGAARCYLADLDGIEGGAPDLAMLRQLADPKRGFGKGLLVDAGVAGPEAARRVLEAGAESVVVGLETLRQINDLAGIVEAVGGEQVVFSLDLHDGEPLQRVRRKDKAAPSPLQLAIRAAEAGVAAISVLDVAAVGSGSGPRHLELVEAVHRLGVPVWVGGGVRSAGDIRTLAEAGCAAVLVATAIHDGTITTLAWPDPGQSPTASR